jgi:hypothetical protein
MPVEIPLKPRQLRSAGKQQKSSSSNSGSGGGKKGKATNGLSALARDAMMKEARAETTRNKMVLVILPSGKRLFVKASELKK